MIYLLHCKDFCKCHNVPPPSTTIKKEEKRKNPKKKKNHKAFRTEYLGSAGASKYFLEKTQKIINIKHFMGNTSTKLKVCPLKYMEK
jgi:hypothetical protein